MMRASTSVRMGVRAAAGSWKRRPLAVVRTDGRSPDTGPVWWMKLCFNHPVVCCCRLLSYYCHVPPLPMLCLYIGTSPVRQRPFIYASNKFVSGGREQVRVIEIN